MLDRKSKYQKVEYLEMFTGLLAIFFIIFESDDTRVLLLTICLSKYKRSKQEGNSTFGTEFFEIKDDSIHLCISNFARFRDFQPKFFAKPSLIWKTLDCEHTFDLYSEYSQLGNNRRSTV